MKKWYKVFIASVVLLQLAAATLNAQSSDRTSKGENDKNAVTIGILQGGGSLIGADYERLVAGPVGFQIGAGYIGLGAGINFHFKPTVRSSFISVVLWNQGLFDEDLTARVLGATYVYRGRKWFTAQIGAGYVLKRSEASEDYLKSIFGTEPASVILLYSIGGYFSF